MKLRFWKYEGAGNDFILIDGRKGSDGAVRVDGTPATEIPSELIRALCDRHRGVGADGFILLLEEPGYDFRMKYYDANGSEAGSCGNGGRCAVLFAHHLGIAATEIKYIGKDGEHYARILSDNGENAIIELSMVDVESYQYSDKAFFINSGAPNYIEFVPDADEVDVVSRGKAVRHSERFTAMGGTNVNFVEIVSHGQIKIRTFERGVETEILSCGTGAVASAIATHLYAQGDCEALTVNVPGGNLDVSFTTENKQKFTDIKLTGPARRVFRGEVDSGNLL